MKQVITIVQTADGKHKCKSLYPDAVTAELLIGIALSFVRKDERMKSETQVVNPHTGRPFINKKVAADG